jgi:hypothetical protein
MSEIITETRSFLHRTPIEPINYNGEMPDVPEKNRKWLKRTMLAALGYMAFVAVDNVAYYTEVARVSADSEQMLYDVDGCDPFPAVVEDEQKNTDIDKPELTDAEKQAILDIEFHFKDTQSAARNLEPKKVDPIEFVFDWYEIHKHEKLAFTSDISGLDVHIYSDTEENPFLIEDMEETTNNIDELIHSSLDENVEYEHAGVEAYTDCLHERFIDKTGPRELEGKELYIYVPSTPGVCFSNGLVQKFPTGAIYKEFCDSTGGTKEIRFALRPFYEYKRTWMTLMTHHKEPEKVEQRLSEKIEHEILHFLMEEAGMPFHYDDNEKLAQYIDGEVTEQLYSEGFPITFAYPAETYEQIED